MHYLSSLTKGLTRTFFKAKEEIHPYAPNWLIALLISLPVATVLLLGINDTMGQKSMWLLLIPGWLSLGIWVLLICTLGCYRHRHMMAHGKEETIELIYFGKVVGSMTAAQLAEIELGHLRDTRKWIGDLVSVIAPGIRYAIFLPLRTLTMTALITFALFYFGEASLEELTDPEMIDKLLAFGFGVTLFASFCALAFNVFRVQIHEDLPRRRKIMAGAGVVGYDPKDILIAPKQALETEDISNSQPA